MVLSSTGRELHGKFVDTFFNPRQTPSVCFVLDLGRSSALTCGQVQDSRTQEPSSVDTVYSCRDFHPCFEGVVS